MKLTIIIGSHQQDSQSHKVGKYLQHQLFAHPEIRDVGMVDLGGNPIPLWDSTYWMADSGLREHMASYMEELSSADGYVIVTPEWGGMVPGGLKNFMLYWSEKETGHKPAMIVSVSGGINGAYPVAELRSSGYKNSKIVYTPEHLIIRHVKDIMNDMDPQGGDGFDKDLRLRAAYGMDVLVAYMKALKALRADTPALVHEKYPFGM
ncbi:MAG: NAD(P)H-dependent oxidoreductase [Rhodospirillales bacterium]|nr:NAD(P)H-dependent oxidoreductase [Rhodospirillales bacterium]MCB9973880.1 NAD(P)H-dependent oxidoreductase [Rhodospirillales bacterium]